jgi:5-methylcytosine-specific restriction enzyme A
MVPAGLVNRTLRLRRAGACEVREDARVEERREDRARRLRRHAAAHRRFAKAVKERDGYRCQRCDGTERLVAHHVKPLQEGGTHHVDNGITLCAACHAPEHQSYEFKLVRGDGSPTRRVLMEAIDELEKYGALTAKEAQLARERLRRY